MSDRDAFENAMKAIHPQAYLKRTPSGQYKRSDIEIKWRGFCLGMEAQKVKADRAQQSGEGREAVAWDHPSVDPIVTKLYRKFKEWSQRGFTADDVTWCEVRGYVAELLNALPPKAQGVPEGQIKELFQLAYLVDCLMTSKAEDNNGDAKEWMRHIDNWMDKNDWLRWQAAVKAHHPATPPSDKPEGEWVPNSEGPTSWEFRFVEALKLMCGGAEPSEHLVKEWLRHESEDLQSWAANNTVLHWSMGITTIEAAMALADEPDEGGEHYGDRPAAPADKPDGEWVKCSERLPTEDDVDFEYRLWCWFPERGDMKLLLLDQIIQAHMSGIAVLWTTTNLKRPAAPDMGGEK